jgi:hypothetical protein
MNIYDTLKTPIALIAATGDFEMAYHQALGTIKALCREHELMTKSKQRHETHTIMGVELHIKYTVDKGEKGDCLNPDYAARIDGITVWLANTDIELRDGELYDAAIEQIENEIDTAQAA